MRAQGRTIRTRDTHAQNRGAPRSNPTRTRARAHTHTRAQQRRMHESRAAFEIRARVHGVRARRTLKGRLKGERDACLTH